jgi:general secretion pathway protein E
MNIKEIHDISLEPLETDGYELALKNYCLYTKMGDEVVIATTKEYISSSFDFLSKIDNPHEVIFLTDISFEKLYNKFLELKTDKEMSAIHQEQENTNDEDEFDASDFLKTSLDILTSEESAPVIKFVNSLFYQAIKQKASDIHIEMHQFKGEIRYRVDGVLNKHIELDSKIMTLVISRIKVISNLDISEKRVPQDGRTQIKIAGKTLDIRVSILPTYYGERVVMRILMQSEDIPQMQELGFDNSTVDGLDSILQNSYGMILVTGPTGSGKSTTLHSLLQKIITPEKNVITVEDPVEYKSDNINQIQVNTKVGLTFASGLRSILRQDPDIIMVGEIRDSETASIAVQAALTGHLVFSTLHTNSSVAAINRLIDMGVEKFLISSSLLGVLAQRLIRKVCPHCKEEDFLAESYAKEFNIPSDTKIYKSVGCKECNFTGYSGRSAIGELFIIDEEIKKYIKGEIEDHKLEQIAIENKMIPIKEQVKKLLIEGETTLEEAIRIGLK